jgi:hypothetical protein
MLNRKPADRLAEIREEVRRLQEEEAELRHGFITGDLDLIGDDYRVIVSSGAKERIDTRALRRDFKPSVLRPYLKSTTVTFVRAELKTEREIK